MGITKIFVTICMNLCNMSPKEACNFQHLFDSLPQKNWFEKFPPGGGILKNIHPCFFKYCGLFRALKKPTESPELVT